MIIVKFFTETKIHQQAHFICAKSNDNTFCVDQIKDTNRIKENQRQCTRKNSHPYKEICLSPKCLRPWKLIQKKNSRYFSLICPFLLKAQRFIFKVKQNQKRSLNGYEYVGYARLLLNEKHCCF